MNHRAPPFRASRPLFVPFVTFCLVPMLLFFVPCVTFFCPEFCPDGRLLVLSRFRVFVPWRVFCPNTDVRPCIGTCSTPALKRAALHSNVRPCIETCGPALKRTALFFLGRMSSQVRSTCPESGEHMHASPVPHGPITGTGLTQ